MKFKKTSSASAVPKLRDRVSALTLIELLILIAVIAILISLLGPAVSRMRERGKQRTETVSGRTPYRDRFVGTKFGNDRTGHDRIDRNDFFTSSVIF